MNLPSKSSILPCAQATSASNSITRYLKNQFSSTAQHSAFLSCAISASAESYCGVQLAVEQASSLWRVQKRAQKLWMRFQLLLLRLDDLPFFLWLLMARIVQLYSGNSILICDIIHKKRGNSITQKRGKAAIVDPRGEKAEKQGIVVQDYVEKMKQKSYVDSKAFSCYSSTNLFLLLLANVIPIFYITMIEDIQTESVAELTANPRFIRTIFNPYQPFIPPASSTTIQPQSKECRICLENTNHQDNELLNLCKCTGSVKYIHDKCFRKWVESQLHQKSKKEQEKILNQGVECQICKDNITLVFEASYRCNCDSFCLKVKRNPIGFAIFVLVFSLVLACIIYLGYNSSRISLDFSSDLVTAIIIISAFAILTLAEVFLLYYCLSDYFLDKFWVLQNYMKKAIPARRNMRIIPQQL